VKELAGKLKYNIKSNDVLFQIKELAKNLNSIKRYTHIKNVESLAVELAERFDVSPEEVSIAAYGHDLMRGLKDCEYMEYCRLYNYQPSKIEIKRPILLHGKISAMYLNSKFDISSSCYNAIYWHVSGHINLDLTGKIIVVSDFCEIGRTHEEATIFRDEAFQNLEKVYLKVIKSKIEWALKKNRPIIPESIEVWNSNFWED
jgi:predicted HD superfamily hydrolase involved in NAD metabolism